MTRYRPMMEAFMRERFPSLEADDIIQETLVALCRVLPSYRYAPVPFRRFNHRPHEASRMCDYRQF